MIFSQKPLSTFWIMLWSSRKMNETGQALEFAWHPAATPGIAPRRPNL
jgi:hypothetical protein